MIKKVLETLWLLHQMKAYQKVDDFKGEARLNHLYKFYPEGTICSDGSQYHALFRKGRKNKLVIVLDGGGLMFDKFSAAYPSPEVYVEGQLGFYDAWCKPSKDAYARLGMFHEKCRQSPFYDWTLLYVPYTCGDFHGGTGSFTYTDREGNEKTFYAHGNINLHKCIEFIKDYCPDPEQLVVCGCSAGGFGSAFVGNDILECFPDCDDCTVIVDGAAFDLDYKEAAETLWQCPESILAQIKSSNIVADGLEYLYEHQKNRVKIGYVISIRDYVLSIYQHYLDTRKDMTAGAEDTARMHKIISDTVLRLSESIPEFSYFLYDYNFNDLKGRPLEGNGGTSHCCLWIPEFMSFEREGVNGIEWVNNVLEGKTTQIGQYLII